MISLGMQSQVQELCLDGFGTTFFGGGVIIETGDVDETSWRRITRCSILNTEGYGLHFSQPRAGYASQVSDCRIVPTRPETHAIKLPEGEAHNGNRSFIGVWSFGNRLIDFGESDNTIMVGCQGAAPTMHPLTKKVIMHGCRIVDSADGSVRKFAIQGHQCSFSGNVLAVKELQFEKSCAGITWRGNGVAGVLVTDHSRGVSRSNEVEIPQTSYVPAWSASSRVPTIGNGQLNGAFRRDGQLAHVNIRLEGGNSTNYGSGTFRFSLPYAASRRSVGSAYIEDFSERTTHIGVAIVVNGTAELMIACNGSNRYAGDGTPMTWGPRDKLWIELSYAID